MPIDVQSILEPVSAELPCGDDLSHTAPFLEMEEAVRTKTQTLVQGEPSQAGEETDWEKVLSQAVELLRRSKDLRLVAYMAAAAVQREGLAGLRSSLAALDGLLEKYWDQLHPQLSPEDNYDPQVRLSALASLHTQGFGDSLRFLGRLREVPLCGAPGTGRFSLRDILIAGGEMPRAASEEPPPLATIQAAFRATPGADLQEKLEAAQQSDAMVQAIEKRLDEKLGPGKAPSFQELRKLLRQMSKHLTTALAGKGLTSADGAGAPAGPGQGPEQAPAAADGEIRSPQDVVRLLEKVCQYYARHEPSSPVPLLVRRAQRLVSKDFLDIIRDLASGAMQQIEMIGGLDKPPAQE